MGETLPAISERESNMDVVVKWKSRTDDSRRTLPRFMFGVLTGDLVQLSNIVQLVESVAQRSLITLINFVQLLLQATFVLGIVWETF